MHMYISGYIHVYIYIKKKLPSRREIAKKKQGAEKTLVEGYLGVITGFRILVYIAHFFSLDVVFLNPVIFYNFHVPFRFTFTAARDLSVCLLVFIYFRYTHDTVNKKKKNQIYAMQRAVSFCLCVKITNVLHFFRALSLSPSFSFFSPFVVLPVREKSRQNSRNIRRWR